MNEQNSCGCSAVDTLAMDTLAMAAFPMQDWCEPYKLDTAIYSGTIFPSLNLSFFDAKDIPSPFCEKSEKAKMRGQENDLMEICKTGFAINDLTLYLDTHPDCPNGVGMIKKLLQQRLDELAKYAKNYHPLTQLSIVTGTADDRQYGWDDGPLPWDPFACEKNGGMS